MIRVIEALEGQLITNTLIQSPCLRNGMLVSDPERDILKIVVYNRFAPAKPAVAFIRNFGLKQGAIASTVAHDSHNIIAVGVEDTDIVKAINLLVHTKGGISVSGPGLSHVLPLPVAGLMSDADGYQVARDYDVIDALAKTLGSKLKAPFMTLSFMALLVIPQLKLSDLGLFDGKSFTFTPLEAESRIV
jgi:adenine deaminase